MTRKRTDTFERDTVRFRSALYAVPCVTVCEGLPLQHISLHLFAVRQGSAQPRFFSRELVWALRSFSERRYRARQFISCDVDRAIP